MIMIIKMDKITNIPIMNKMNTEMVINKIIKNKKTPIYSSPCMNCVMVNMN